MNRLHKSVATGSKVRVEGSASLNLAGDDWNRSRRNSILVKCRGEQVRDIRTGSSVSHGSMKERDGEKEESKDERREEEG